MFFSKLIYNIRFYVLLFSSILAGSVYFCVKQTVEGENSQIIRLTQTYALIAVTYLYLALLASPLTRFFTFIPYRNLYLKARRAIGVSAFLFASLHMWNAFFGELGGFGGLQFLNLKYLTAISLGAISLTILTLMAATSTEWAVSKLSYPRWKFLHRFVYLAAILTTIHALMLGSHFTDFSGWIPQIFSVALAFLLILEALRLDIYLARKFPHTPKAGVAFFVTALLITLLTVFTFPPANFTSNLSLHEDHRKMIKESLKNPAMKAIMKMPGMTGDRTKRYTVDWDYSESLAPGKETNLKFRIFDASNGAPVNLFTKNYEKLMHLIIVDQNLQNYQHLHPEFKDGWFEIAVNFPVENRYHLYLDFIPNGAIEQQFGLALNVGQPQPVSESLPEKNFKKQFNDYQVMLNFNSPLKASQMSAGTTHLNFEITKDNQPVTTLKPYLGSFGHLVMINTKTFEYTHVHPAQTGNLLPDQNGGPSVDFIPMSLYAPIKPGIYKLFGQFNPDGNLITADFTIKIE